METGNQKQAMTKMEKARSRLIFDHPFYGAQTIRYPLKSADTIGNIKVDTAATNGIDIVFNPDYINGLTLDNTIFLNAHETLHNMFTHGARCLEYPLDIRNRAADYLVNDILISENIGKPMEDILIDSQYAKMSYQEICKELYGKAEKENKQSNSGSNQDNNGQNDAGSNKGHDEKSSPGANSEVEKGGKTDNNQFLADSTAGSFIDMPKNKTIADIESELKESIQSAITYAKKAGKMPGPKLQKIISEILAPKANWKQLLQQWIDSTDKTDVSFIRPKNRGTGYFQAGYYSEGLNQLVIAIDVSGSVLSVPKSIETFQAELNSLKSAYQFDCMLIYFHSNIERIETYQRHENIKIEVKETGGTQTKPIFDYIQDNGLNNQISGLIVFTDLEICDFPETEPIYKTLFVKYGNNKYLDKAPIGETITIE